MRSFRARPVRARLPLAVATFAAVLATAAMPSPALASMSVSSNASWRNSTPQRTVLKTGAPVAPTDGAQLDADAVQLHGTVMPHGRRTRVWFEFGSTPALGGATVIQRLPAGYTPVSLTDSLPALGTGS